MSEKPLDKREPETIDGATGKPDPTPSQRTINLSNLRDVRLELAYLYRQVDAGKVDSRDGSRRAFILRQIADILTTAELERRLQDLEDRQEAMRSGRLIEHQSGATAH